MSHVPNLKSYPALKNYALLKIKLPIMRMAKETPMIMYTVSVAQSDAIQGTVMSIEPRTCNVSNIMKFRLNRESRKPPNKKPRTYPTDVAISRSLVWIPLDVGGDSIKDFVSPWNGKDFSMVKVLTVPAPIKDAASIQKLSLTPNRSLVYCENRQSSVIYANFRPI